jgi:hypothetical protein
MSLRAQRSNLHVLPYFTTTPPGLLRRLSLLAMTYFPSCHCERSEAISSFCPTSPPHHRDCFVVVAPRNDILLHVFASPFATGEGEAISSFCPTSPHHIDCFVVIAPRNDILIFMSLRAQRSNLLVLPYFTTTPPGLLRRPDQSGLLAMTWGCGGGAISRISK